MNKGHQMTMERKRAIVKAVLGKALGCANILHGDKLVEHVARSIVLYEKFHENKSNARS